MAVSRRIFLEKIAQLSAFAALDYSIDYDIEDEQFWKRIKRDFDICKSDILQLNSGSAGAMPRQVIDALHQLHHFMNNMPPYDAWEIWQDERLSVKNNLAKLINVSADEIAIQRNTTEALNNILLGLSFEPEDEIIAADHEYPAMLNALKNRMEKKQLKLKQVSFNFPIHDDQQIIETYLNSITKKTKYILISHMTFNHGRIMPIKKLNQALESSGIKLIIDGAHSFAHIDFDLKDIGADFYATSLHKWLSGPHGTGLLYIAKDHIHKVDHLLSTSLGNAEKIEKFEHIGTRAFYNEIALKFSLDYLMKIGIANKENRLRNLNTYAIEKLSHFKGFTNCTSNNSTDFAGVIAFQVDSSKNNRQIVKLLRKDFGIAVKSTRINDSSGIRLSPNVFTLKSDIDYLATSLHKIIS